jgi:hypothetical protein
VSTAYRIKYYANRLLLHDGPPHLISAWTLSAFGRNAAFGVRMAISHSLPNLLGNPPAARMGSIASVRAVERRMSRTTQHSSSVLPSVSKLARAAPVDVRVTAKPRSLAFSGCRGFGTVDICLISLRSTSSPHRRMEAAQLINATRSAAVSDWQMTGEIPRRQAQKWHWHVLIHLDDDIRCGWRYRDSLPYSSRCGQRARRSTYWHANLAAAPHPSLET